MTDNKPKKISPIVIEGLEITGQNVSFSKLQEFSLTLFEKLLTQRKQRNWLMLERDKLRTILENTRYEIRLAEDICLNRDHELDLLEERCRKELRGVQQHVKFLEYDHGKSLEDVKEWENLTLKRAKDKHLVEELELLQEKRSLKENLARETNRYNEEVNNLKMKHVDEIANLRQELFDVQLEKEMEFKKNFGKLVQHLLLKHEMELSELEERKNIHLNELKKIQKTRIDETKNFFNSVTAENLTVISNLKQSLSNIKVNKVDLLSKVQFLKDDNASLREPLKNSETNVKTLKKHLVNYEKDLLSLKNNKMMLRKTLEQIRLVKKENSTTTKKLSILNSDALQSNFDCFHLMQDFKMNTYHKRKRLEKVISCLLCEFKRKQKTIQDLTSDSDVLKALAHTDYELWSPKQLSYELAIVSKAHDDLLRTLQEKLKEFCVPETDLKLNALNMKYTAANPAALVSKQ